MAHSVIYLCELCGAPGVYRYVLGFQMVACDPCARSLMDARNWQPVKAPTSRPDYQPLVDEWRQRRYRADADGAPMP